MRGWVLQTFESKLKQESMGLSANYNAIDIIQK